MKLIKPSFEILSIMSDDYFDDDPLQLIELAGRTCYKSENKISENSARDFIAKILKRGHESVIEHSAMTVKFICDRGVTYELVRHRLCSFSQESTRFVDYKDGVTFVLPPWVDIPEGDYPLTIKNSNAEGSWMSAIALSEIYYLELLEKGWTPQQARSVLPNSIKAEIIMTTNFREWRHIFRLRCSKAAHPQMREIMVPLLKECQNRIPIIFDDIKVEY